MPRTRFARLALAALTMQLALAACGGEEAARFEAMVGTYSYEKSEQAGPGGQRIRERTTLILRDDHHWTMLREATVDGAPYLSSPDSGSYSFKGTSLVTNSPITGVLQYAMSGDTLWIGVAPGEDGAGYLVRER